jgi:cytochrome c peroxidase
MLRIPRTLGSLAAFALPALVSPTRGPGVAAIEHPPPAAAPVEELGRRLFFDPSLSVNRTASCASCHDPERAFTGNNSPDAAAPVARGAPPGAVGRRNVPSLMYAAFSPAFSIAEDEEGEWRPLGGQFWDGRAATLAIQAVGPVLDPREMAMPGRAELVARVRAAPYASAVGRDGFDDVPAASDAIGSALAAFERTAAFSPFDSKFDAVLRGQARFTPDEAAGFALFQDPEKGNCIACHAGDPSSRDPRAWLFTDFSYDALGVPRNLAITDNADPDTFDLGLCAQPGLRDRIPAEVEDAYAFLESLCGAFKVPTLRNVARTAPYMHNGVFATLEQVVAFYVTRDTSPERWYPSVDGQVVAYDDLPPKYRDNVNTGEAPYDRAPGEAPRMSPSEIRQVVAFLGTLSDGEVR